MEMDFELKTGFDWCVEYNIRPLTLEGFGDNEFAEHSFFEYKITRSDFLDAISNCVVKPNSRPRKSAEYLEHRMYGLVPYNISSIQSAIQYGHAVQEFNNLMLDGISTTQSVEIDKSLIIENRIAFNKWRKKDKTFIVLNGGTTNENFDDRWYGSMQKNRDLLYNNNILFAEFYEPDLNNTLTAIVFLVDERVYDKVTYPNFEKETLPYSKRKPSEKQLKELEERNAENYEKWVEKMGGQKNVFLREFLSGFKLAN